MSKDFTEPTITINGVKLNNAEAMTVRVAIASFHMTIDFDGLGEDEHGKFMAKAYKGCLRSIHEALSREGG